MIYTVLWTTVLKILSVIAGAPLYIFVKIAFPRRAQTHCSGITSNVQRLSRGRIGNMPVAVHSLCRGKFDAHREQHKG